LNDIDPLASLTSLQHLSLLENPVTKKQHYRLYTIHKLPKLRVLDFKKVKQRVLSFNEIACLLLVTCTHARTHTRLHIATFRDPHLSSTP
jgi:hypothetical protein